MRSRSRAFLLAALARAAGCGSKRERAPADQPARSPTTATTPTAAASAPRVLGTLPEFVLADERGESLDLYDLHGTVWIAGFSTATAPTPATRSAAARPRPSPATSSRAPGPA